MINVWEHVNARAEAMAFCELYGVEGPVLLDEPGAYAAELGIRGVPANILVDEKGIVRTVGATSPEELLASLSALGVELD
jgi:hypothetical protein